MNREIKFRAWNTDDNKMEYPLVLAICNDGTLNFKPLIKCADGNNAYKDYPLMQFTGLHDKNGKEIYEGDIVILHKYKSQVIFQEGKFKFVTKNNNGDYVSWNYYKQETNIIGNIYENPELLTQNK